MDGYVGGRGYVDGQTSHITHLRAKPDSERTISFLSNTEYIYVKQ